ncbi:glycoside hydrolase family 43 protein [Kineococcus rhizosphaerae]|uniref:Glycosyl hydrolase family 43 n=1 Tax=Kineococcus rhizosphaerae TaxID=559628 RepID=A0A2T0R2E4_9ACTN|nr:glycoside hydrolase family 43 protein [Kineococcus rhizosphaerae]PRY13950.1 glycosyl hydrolase family 43 [Kineococcus rhizosphaerae]
MSNTLSNTVSNHEPVIAGFFPDPSICRAGDTYVLVNSSFEYLPGLPVHTSTDLTTWTFAGNALTRVEQIAESGGHPSSGMFAPTIRHHDGRYWIIGTDVNGIPAGRGHFLIHATDPAGPWSDPVHLPEAIGIDPDIAWDEHGTAHVTWCSLDPSQPGIRCAPFDTATGALLAPSRQLWSGTGLAAPEGPHLYRRDGWWYLLLAEGGTERGHTATIARARTLEGSFEANPRNPFLTHRSLTHPVQNVGHADLVELPDGRWAAVHLGVRNRGPSPGFHVNGRETFLVGIDWVQGWPVVDEDRFDVPPADHAFHDRFTAADLHPRWLGAGRFPASFARTGPDGLVLDAGGGRSLLAARATDETWTASTEVSLEDGSCRFLLRIDDRHWYGLTYDGHAVEAVLTIGPVQHTVGRWEPETDTPGTATLGIRVTAPRSLAPGLFSEPDGVELLAGSNGSGGFAHSFGVFDGRYLSTEVAGGFTGRVFGVEAVSGQTRVHAISYQPGDRTPPTP